MDSLETYDPSLADIPSMLMKYNNKISSPQMKVHFKNARH
jgi:hypothetical protein